MMVINNICKITWDILETIYKSYNPLGQKHYFLVDEFLEWAKQEGSYYWIMDGAEELDSGNPKEIIKEIPFIKVEGEYRELLRSEWLRFLNIDKKKRENIIMELDFLSKTK